MLPAVVAVLALGLGAVQVSAQQVRLADAAADAARASARGESSAEVQSLAARHAPGSSVAVANEADLVCVVVTRTARVFALSVPLSARACALAGGL